MRIFKTRDEKQARAALRALSESLEADGSAPLAVVRSAASCAEAYMESSDPQDLVFWGEFCCVFVRAQLEHVQATSGVDEVLCDVVRRVYV